MRYRILLQEIFNAGKEFKDFQNKLRTGLVENYDAVYVERKNQNCLWLKGFIREMSKIQIKKYRFFIRYCWRINNFMIFYFWKNGNYLKANLLKGRDAKLEGHWHILAGVFFVCKNEYENWQGQVLCIQIKAGWRRHKTKRGFL